MLKHSEEKPQQEQVELEKHASENNQTLHSKAAQSNEDVKTKPSQLDNTTAQQEDSQKRIWVNKIHNHLKLLIYYEQQVKINQKIANQQKR